MDKTFIDRLYDLLVQVVVAGKVTDEMREEAEKLLTEIEVENIFQING